MGIEGLSKLIAEKAGKGIQKRNMESLFGRTIAIDASCFLYQFLIAMKGFREGHLIDPTNAEGEVTSHLLGLWNRTVRMVSEGIRPIYVFDGPPPEPKSGEISRRQQRASDAASQLEFAAQKRDDRLMERLSKRTVRVSRQQTEECKKLVRLMGLPLVEAPQEAEAQCAALVLHGQAWAVGTEDMDALTFNAPRVLRHLSYSPAAGLMGGIIEYDMKEILDALNFSREQFVDLCILLGCDYTGKIPGVGPVRALEGIRQHGSIEKFLAHLDTSRHAWTPELFNYEVARDLFRHPVVRRPEEIKLEFSFPDEQGLLKFLVEEKLFSEERVLRGYDQLRKARGIKTQSRLDHFFPFRHITSSPQPKMDEKGRKKIHTKLLPSGKLEKKKHAGGKKAVIRS